MEEEKEKEKEEKKNLSPHLTFISRRLISFPSTRTCSSSFASSSRSPFYTSKRKTFNPLSSLFFFFSNSLHYILLVIVSLFILPSSFLDITTKVIIFCARCRAIPSMLSTSRRPLQSFSNLRSALSYNNVAH